MLHLTVLSALSGCPQAPGFARCSPTPSHSPFYRGSCGLGFPTPICKVVRVGVSPKASCDIKRFHWTTASNQDGLSPRSTNGRGGGEEFRTGDLSEAVTSSPCVWKRFAHIVGFVRWRDLRARAWVDQKWILSFILFQNYVDVHNLNSKFCHWNCISNLEYV